MLRLLLMSICIVVLLAGRDDPAQHPPSRAERGVAARYSTNRLMERAAEINGVSARPGEDYCASPTHPLHTHLVVLSRVKGRTTQSVRCVVGDVAHPRDVAAIRRRGIVIELTPRAAMVICGSVREPPRQCPVEVRLWRTKQ